jgi:hypothetical protein
MSSQNPDYLRYKAAEYTDAHLRAMFVRVIDSELFLCSPVYRVLESEMRRRTRNRGFDLFALLSGADQ